MTALPTHNSLIKYSTPVLVSISGKKASSKPPKKDPLQPPSSPSKTLSPVSSEAKNNKEENRTEDILNKIIPPKEHLLPNGQLWIQTVLSTPATKTEVISLKEELEKRLQQRMARETGICPIREGLYDECFDELIRQITIDCKERGLLLVRVRDEIRQQLKSYKTLYESSIAYGMRKMIDSEQKKSNMHNKIMILEKECSEYEKMVEELEKKIVNTKKVENEKMTKENQEHQSEVNKVKETNVGIKYELEKLLSGRK